MAKLDLHEFAGMPGVKGKLKGPMMKTPTGFLSALRTFRAVSDAGDHGSVMVYLDDAGAYRCTFMVHHVTREQKTFTNKQQVGAWLKEWLPKQRNFAA